MQGKVIVVTGAFGALGRAVVARAKAQGARPAMLGRSQPPAEMAAEPLAFGSVDLSAPEAAVDAIAKVRAAAGRIDALLNVAGGFTWRTVEESDAALWERMFALNL